MPLTDVISVRLPAGKRFLYEKEAAHQGQSLGTYLRERLEQDKPVPHQNIQPSSSRDQGVLLEILLLLRSISSPEKMNIVQKELKRLNISVWNMDSPYGQEKRATSSNFS